MPFSPSEIRAEEHHKTDNTISVTATQVLRMAQRRPAEATD